MVRKFAIERFTDQEPRDYNLRSVEPEIGNLGLSDVSPELRIQQNSWYRESLNEENIYKPQAGLCSGKSNKIAH